jgi:hypothetical protein
MSTIMIQQISRDLLKTDYIQLHLVDMVLGEGQRSLGAHIWITVPLTVEPW